MKDTEYVPIDRNHLAMQIGSTTRREQFTRADYYNALPTIQEALKKSSSFVPQTKYAGILYPEEAVAMLQLSRSRHWPGYSPDGVLEYCLVEWMSKIEQSPEEYAQNLFNALHELDCLEGVYLRLNHDVIALMDMSTIRITTPIGSTVHKKRPRRDVLIGETRKRVKTFLQKEGKFAGHIDVVYSGLQRVHATYDLEQSLLSWMGYIIVRTIAENFQPAIFGNRLVIEQQRVGIPGPPPNHPQ